MFALVYIGEYSNRETKILEVKNSTFRDLGDLVTTKSFTTFVEAYEWARDRGYNVKIIQTITGTF